MTVNVIDRRAALAITPFFRLGFRPFFLLGSILAMLAIPLWVMALNGWFADWQPTGGWLAWHRHELLFGFAAAIIAGFLLTAVQTWTGCFAPGLVGWCAGMVRNSAGWLVSAAGCSADGAQCVAGASGAKLPFSGGAGVAGYSQWRDLVWGCYS